MTPMSEDSDGNYHLSGQQCASHLIKKSSKQGASQLNGTKKPHIRSIIGRSQRHNEALPSTIALSESIHAHHTFLGSQVTRVHDR